MRKKNIGNQAVIKAITIGLSAVMATAQPITVLASETDDVQQPTTSVDSEASDIEGGVADNAQAAVDAVEEAVESSDIEKTDAKDALAEVAKEQNTDFTYGEAGVNEAGEDNATNVKNAIDEVAKDTVLANVSEKMEIIDNSLVVIENVDVKESKLAENTVGEVNEAVKVAEDITSYMDEATASANDLKDAIINATKISDAKDAYNELEKLATEAADEVEKANKNLTEIEEKYNSAKEQLLAAAKTYNAMVEHASSEAGAAKDYLDEAEEKVAVLKAAVEEAKKGVNATNQGALDIIKIQNEVKDNASIDWRAEDKLFNAIVENYYVASIAEGAKDVKSTRVQGADNDTYNYFKVTYKNADGVEQEPIYLNFMMDGKSKCNIVIFEKTKTEVEASDYLNSYIKNNKITNADEKKAVINSGVYSYEEGGVTKYITGAELDAMGEGVATVDGVKYITGEAGAKDIKISSVVAPVKSDLDVNGKKEAVDVATSTKHFEMIDGVLTLVETADVTRTEYQRLESEYSDYKKNGYTAEEKDALIKALGDGVSFAEVIDEKQLDENGDPITYYVLTGTSYIPTFTTEGIDVNRRCDSGKILEIFGKESGRENAKNEVVSDIQGSLNNSKYTIIQNNLSAGGSDSVIDSGDEDYSVTGTVTVVINDCTVTLNAEEFTTGEFTSEEAAKLALEKLVKGYLANDGVNASVNVNTEYDGGFINWITGKSGDVKETKSYNTTEDYKDLEYSTDEYNKIACYVDYLKVVSTKLENDQVISTEEYNTAAAISAAIIQNKEYIAKNFELVEATDEGLKEFLDAAQDLVDKYNRIGEEAVAAQNSLEVTEAKVDELSSAIDELKKQDNKIITAIEALGVDDLAKYLGIELENEADADKLNKMTLDEAIKYLDDKFEKAKNDVDKAKERLDDLDKELEEAEEDLKKTIRKLTPKAPVEEDVIPDDTSDDDDTPVVAVVPSVDGDTIVNLDLLMANAPVVGGVVAGANRETVAEIADNEVPLAGSVEEKISESTPENKQEVKAAEIADNEVPLAGDIVNEETARSWWWLILVAIATALGFGSYKYSKSKKKEAVISDSEK